MNDTLATLLLERLARLERTMERIEQAVGELRGLIEELDRPDWERGR